MTKPLRFGRYNVVELIQRGTRSSVYRAVDSDTDRRVAIKLFVAHGLDALSRGREHERLEEEFERLARQRHAGIINLYEVGQAGDSSYVAMELCEEMTLETALERGPLLLQATIRILDALATTLDELNGVDIIHHGLKAANVFINGSARLSDWIQLGSVRAELLRSELEAPRVMHVAPEQVLGYPYRRPANVYSLAALAYRMLTGEYPYGSRSAVDYLYNVVYGSPVVPSTCNEALSVRVDAVLMRGLCTTPEDRFATCHELVSALKSALGVESPEAELEAMPDDVVVAEIGTVAGLAIAHDADDADSIGSGRFVEAATALGAVLAMPRPIGGPVRLRSEPDAATDPEPEPSETAMGVVVPMSLFDSRELAGRAESSPRPTAPPNGGNRPLSPRRPQTSPSIPVPVTPLQTVMSAVPAPTHELELQPVAATPVVVESFAAATDGTPAPLSPAWKNKPGIPATVAFDRKPVEPAPADAVAPYQEALSKKSPGFVAKLKGLIARLKPGGDRLPPTTKLREAYLTDWRAGITQPNQTLPTATVPPVETGWKLRVEGDDASARIFVDGEYAGAVPAELSLAGHAGDTVRVEIRRGDDILATTDIKLHPLMRKVWKPA